MLFQQTKNSTVRNEAETQFHLGVLFCSVLSCIALSAREDDALPMPEEAAENIFPLAEHFRAMVRELKPFATTKVSESSSLAGALSVMSRFLTERFRSAMRMGDDEPIVTIVARAEWFATVLSSFARTREIPAGDRVCLASFLNSVVRDVRDKRTPTTF